VKRALVAIFALIATVAVAQHFPIKKDEEVIFFPTIGHSVAGSEEWELPIHGWIFEPEQRRISLEVLKLGLGLKGVKMTTDEEKIFKDRARAFMVDDERKKTISIAVNGISHTLETSHPDGHFRGEIRLSNQQIGESRGTVPFHALTREGDKRKFEGTVHLIEDSGVSVVCDIDDTIKVSDVRNHHELLRNTFCRDFRPVPGMASVLQGWVTNSHAQFHYVSASPWQLYPALDEFIRNNGFPVGSFHLKQFRFKDQTFFSLFQSPEVHKRQVLEPMLKQFPKRRFVFVGDSGEKDPEIYGSLAREFPNQVVRIYIRSVTGESTESPRYPIAFAGLPPAAWKVFKEPSEIERLGL